MGGPLWDRPVRPPSDRVCLRDAERRLREHIATAPASQAEIDHRRVALEVRLALLLADIEFAVRADGPLTALWGERDALRREMRHLPVDQAAARVGWEETRAALEERVQHYRSLCAADARGGPRDGAGRPVASSTGERRAAWNVSIAPVARARVEAEAARRSMSPSALLEEWALGLPEAP